MLFEEFQVLRNRSDLPQPDHELAVTPGEGDLCIVENLYPFQLEASSSIYPREETITILDADGGSLGELVTCASEQFGPLASLSAEYLACYLADTTAAQYGQAGSFSHDFLLVPVGRVAEYRADYQRGSAIWGGFQHAAAPTICLVTARDPVRAVKRLNLPTPIHEEAARRSVSQPFAFERFLKLYHLLELSFDRDFVLKVQKLGSDLVGIGQLLSGLKSDEMSRLNQILRDCRHRQSVIDCVRTLSSDPIWHSAISTIFFDFSKAGNPIQDGKDEFIAIISTSGYTLEGMRSLAKIPGKVSQVQQQKLFEDFTLKLAAYWIYRVRSSIAHSRIGEYVMKSDDEPFVTFFAEPLLRCILTQLL